MPQYRKKPVVVEAFQWTGRGFVDIPVWLLAALSTTQDAEGSVRRHDPELKIFTREGVMTANPGDWIIQGVKGELYPCKPEIFEATYESAEKREEFDLAALQRLRKASK